MTAKKNILTKTCPFCGGKAELRDKLDGNTETYEIHCNSCHMNFSRFVWRCMDEKNVIKDWDKRASE